ncbi:MAG: CopG family transcriptional regulator [Methanobacteriota archaeon]
MAGRCLVTEAKKLKEVKVRIPSEQHVRLHELKITEGVSISEAIEQAVDEYLARHAPGPAAAAPGTSALRARDEAPSAPE